MDLSLNSLCEDDCLLIHKQLDVVPIEMDPQNGMMGIFTFNFCNIS
jgi:hypothetical protein